MGLAPHTWAQSLTATAPRLALGTTHISQKLSGALTLRNTGTQVIRVFAIEPSCTSCTVVEFQSQDVAPGATIQIPVHLSNLESVEKHFIGRLNIRCNDPQRPEFAVIQEGHFVPAVGVDRWSIDLGSVIPSGTHSIPVTFSNWAEAMTVEVDPASADLCEVAAGRVFLPAGTPTAPSQVTATLLVHVPAGAEEKSAQFSHVITFATTNPNQPTLHLTVFGTLAPTAGGNAPDPASVATSHTDRTESDSEIP